MTTTLGSTGVQEAADLGRKVAELNAARVSTGWDELDSTLIARVVNGQIVTKDLEEFCPFPREARGSATLYDPASFAAYVNRLHSGQTTMWADQEKRQIVAVFNDHDGGDNAQAGWRDHVAVLEVRRDKDWHLWLSFDQRYSDQIEFGEFLQSQAHTIVEPKSATMVQIATSMTAKRDVNFESAVQLQSGDVQFVYQENTTSKAGKLDIPSQFTLALSPFEGGQPVPVMAWLRHRIDRNGLRIGYRLQRPDIAARDAFAGVVKQVDDNTPDTVPMLFGQRPEPLR